MTDMANKALLPTGLRDILPPDASLEAHVVDRLGQTFRQYGYERVKPPLIEFEEGLLEGAGAALAKDTFRVMDPISQRMMGVRADMTIQVARIASSRLARLPRPLRLCYSGQVLRVKGTQLRPERQFTQAGLELIGSDAPAADAEVVALTAGALDILGVQDVSIDLNLPTLISVLCHEMAIAPKTCALLRSSFDQKDEAAVRAGCADLPGKVVDLFVMLLRCRGEAGSVLDLLDRLDLPGVAILQRERLRKVVELVRVLAPALSVTVDVVENRGFEYHTGISFAVFTPQARGELARGGRYLAGESAESAVGASVDVDAVMGVLSVLPTPRRLFVPVEARNGMTRFHDDGWVTVGGLEPVGDVVAEAARLGCSHYFCNGMIFAVPQE